MKKTLTILAIMSIAFIGAKAQTTTESGLGIRAAWDYSVPETNIDGLDSGSGVSLGAIYDIPLYQGLFFEPGLSFFYDTMDLDYFDVYFNGRNVGVNGTLRNYGFRIPMTFGYKIDLVDDISMSLLAGPQLNVGLGNKMHYDNKAIEDLDLYDAGWRRCDLQVMFGLKLHYSDNFFAEITGALGVTNMINGHQYKNSHIRRNLVSLGVGYKF